jgi:tRNA pseudouridine55 synthase
MNFDEGAVILVDKPYEWTSFDVVKKLKYQLKIRKIGHAGTLDPLATGLLILCTGKKTKTINEFMSLDKTYEGEMILGKTTPSYDLETAFQATNDITFLNESLLDTCVKKFQGEIFQVPPAHSAIKVDGKRAYESARKGKEVALKARQIRIEEFNIGKLKNDRLPFYVKCSKGTYIRSLVRDFGECLGCGATLSLLRRTAIGQYHVDDADDLQTLLNKYRSAT